MHCAAFVAQRSMQKRVEWICIFSSPAKPQERNHVDRNHINRALALLTATTPTAAKSTAPTLTAAADITHPRRCPGQVHPTAGKKLAPLATRAEPQFNLGMPESALHQFGENGLHSATSLSVRRCGADFHFPAPPNVPVIPFPSSTVKMRSTAGNFPFSTTPSGQ
jgi:hypothetical protein